uniref:Uncharacterized protein n=1 Tax=Xiphophorus couchianus TaxID=32473 RepID=A0A3B5L5T4_9TELE
TVFPVDMNETSHLCLLPFRQVCNCVCAVLQIVCGLDQVKLLNPPEEALPDHLLRVFYSCDGAATVQLDCVVSFETGSVSTVPIRRWSCVPSDPVIRTVKLNLPDWLVYQADGIVPESHRVLSCFLRASVRYSGSDDTKRSKGSQDVAFLLPKPFFSRPIKQHRLCTAWSKQMLQLTQQFLQKKCPLEQETIHLLSALYASTGESFGITKSLDPYRNELLEHFRVKAVPFPWCELSLWVFVSRYCEHRLCGVFHHIDSHNNYATPALLLTKSGRLHIQISGASEESSAFLSSFAVPLNKWCQLTLTLQGRTVSDLMLSHSAMLDDTEGYFVIGGGKFIRGLEGYFGPVVYYRNRLFSLVFLHPQSDAAAPEVIKNINLTGWLQSCQEFLFDITVKISGFTLKAKHQRKSGNVSFCPPDVMGYQTPAGGTAVSPSAVGRALYSFSVQKMSQMGSSAAVRKVLPLLLQAGCLADNHALHMSSVLYSSGLGFIPMFLCWSQAWLLALLAAQRDHRLALLHLGHVHQRGLHGLPKDPDLAYAYYANIAKQTTLDRHNPTPQQTFVEAVYLNDDEALNRQTNEDHHIFQWLKLQARRGAADAEQALARMLFWGQQGLSPNIQEAVKHYRRGAVQLEDPASMYDYAIVLLLGQGVEKDVPKGVTFLKKAMEQGFVPAVNALAWYYEQFEKDYQQAVALWEEADLLGSPDAPLNLGVLYSQGLYPGKPADQVRKHAKAHIPCTLVWVKWTAEQNGYLGTVLRKALDSYLKSDTFISLVFYMMAAESGYSPAQFNVAYLCEQNAGFLDPAYATRCMWRYYNLTIQSQKPDSYAFIRMGDLLYEGSDSREKDFSSAAHMYSLAALRKNPQGWYNLGLLAEDGYRLPLPVLIELGLSELHLADKNLLLSTLYKRLAKANKHVFVTLVILKVYFFSSQMQRLGQRGFVLTLQPRSAQSIFAII